MDLLSKIPFVSWYLLACAGALSVLTGGHRLVFVVCVLAMIATISTRFLLDDVLFSVAGILIWGVAATTIWKMDPPQSALIGSLFALSGLAYFPILLGATDARLSLVHIVSDGLMLAALFITLFDFWGGPNWLANRNSRGDDRADDLAQARANTD